jgi:hypothetical protein
MNNLDQWIDPRVKQVKAASLHAYLLQHDWVPKPSPRPLVLLFEEPPGEGGQRIVQAVPAEDGGRDYADSIVRAITTLAALEGRSPVEILNDILQQSPAAPASVNGPGTPHPRPGKP